MITAQEVALKFSVAQTELLQALQLVSNAVPSRTTLPVLSNILVEAADGSLQLTATDLDLSITTKAMADVKSDGALTVPAKKLLELARKLPKEDLKLEAKDLTLNVVSKTGRFKFLCIRPEEFPARPNVSPDVHLTIEAKAFERLVRRTIYAVSTDETRPALNGALFQMSEGEIRLVATDGHRLARATLTHPAAT
jgi:DNA polymerase-3 subunit beta